MGRVRKKHRRLKTGKPKESIVDDTNLANISTDDLAKELRERMLAEKNTLWPFEVYKLVAAIGILPCVDAFPVRKREGQLPEIGMIVRNTGPYKGKNMKWCVGGRINQGESFSRALRRHYQEVLGAEIHLAPGLAWNRPVMVSQHGPERIHVEEDEFAGDEPTKYCLAPTYLVELTSRDVTFGRTAHGGQEASGLLWFPVNALPPEAEIAYGGMQTVLTCAKWAREHL